MVRSNWRGLDCGNWTILGEKLLREADGGGGNTIQGLFSSDLRLFEVMLMSGMDRIKSCFEDYILLFLFDVCFHFFYSYVRVLSVWNFGFGDISLFNFIYSAKFRLVFS